MKTPRWIRPKLIEREKFTLLCRLGQVSEAHQLTAIINMWVADPEVRTAVAKAEAKALSVAYLDAQRHATTQATAAAERDFIRRTPDDQLDPKYLDWKRRIEAEDRLAAGPAVRELPSHEEPEVEL